jgi:hypothetical protein
MVEVGLVGLQASPLTLFALSTFCLLCQLSELQNEPKNSADRFDIWPGVVIFLGIDPNLCTFMYIPVANKCKLGYFYASGNTFSLPHFHPSVAKYWRTSVKHTVLEPRIPHVSEERSAAKLYLLSSMYDYHHHLATLHLPSFLPLPVPFQSPPSFLLSFLPHLLVCHVMFVASRLSLRYAQGSRVQHQEQFAG